MDIQIHDTHLTIEILGILVIAGVLLLALAVGVAIVLFRRPVKRVPITTPDLSIDIAALDASGPPVDGVRLEYYGAPVRLAVLVLAPAGRSSGLPPPEQLSELLEYWIPGLSGVVESHHPLIRKWPEQLSSQGFTQAFFHNLQLPGDRGKGTPWCSAAGKFEFQGQHLLGGLLCCAASPTGLSQTMVQHEGLWHDVLRVRDDPPT